MLFHLEPNLIVNSDTIASMKATFTAEGRECVEVVFTDGKRKIALSRIEEIECFVGPIIPAPPGYQVIRAFTPEKDGEPTTFMMLPVIAFRITSDEPMPITPFGKLGDHWALVWPDGRADEQWNRLWDNVEEFKAAFGPRGERS